MMCKMAKDIVYSLCIDSAIRNCKKWFKPAIYRHYYQTFQETVNQQSAYVWWCQKLEDNLKASNQDDVRNCKTEFKK